jgi:hypothetical protein
MGKMTNNMLEMNIKELSAYQQLPDDDLQKKAVVISKKMLKAAGKITPTELGAASALCLELALFIKSNGV